METQTIELEKLVDWSEPRAVQTKSGPMTVRKYKIAEGDDFWSTWKSCKAELKSAGISVGKWKDEWYASWWQSPTSEETKRRDDELAKSRAQDCDIDIPCPEGLAYLPYQKAGIAYGLDRDNVLIADDMGLGKTIQAIGIANCDDSIRQVLIVCPSSLRLNWMREWEKWFMRGGTVHVVDGGKASAWKHADCIIVNYDVLSKHRGRIDLLNIDLLIIDEAHYAKNAKTARTKALYGSRTERGIEARRRVALTGTPILNRPIELWTLAESFAPNGLGSNFMSFAKRYCDAKQVRVNRGRKQKLVWDFKGNSNLGELQERLRRDFMIRRLKKDVLTELPPKRRQIIEIPSSGIREVQGENAAFAAHQENLMKLEAEVELAKASEEPGAYEAAVENLKAEVQFAFSEIAEARKETAIAKVLYVVDHLKDALESGPVICFAHHREVIRRLMNEFPDAVKITGDVSIEDRQKAVDDFQSGKSNLFIGNILAAGVGLTLTRSSHVVFAELDWVPGNVTQAEDRAHRIGQENSVLVQHLVFEDSVDAVMAKSLVRKQNVIDRALDKATEAVAVPVKGRVNKITVRRTDIDEAAESITDTQVAAIHAGLRVLAGHCDGAKDLDGMGFSAVDVRIGHSLARQSRRSKRQAVIGLKLVNKYRRQLGDDLVSTAKGVA